ncbi:MAG: hypothetical protein AAF683_12880, partial [Pseudomonadota bacterium]
RQFWPPKAPETRLQNTNTPTAPIPGVFVGVGRGLLPLDRSGSRAGVDTPRIRTSPWLTR